MTHFSFEDWLKYIQNELTEELRTKYEDHLYQCDACLEIYLEAVSEQETTIPTTWNEELFTNKVMANISALKDPMDIVVPEGNEKRFYQKAFFHYALAATMTILLMASGVFQSLLQYVDEVQKPHFHERKASLTNGMVDKTFAWIDSLEEKNKEGLK